MATIRNRIEGWLFDIDELGPWVTLWVYDDDGRLHRLTDEFYPPVYAHGDRAKLKQLAANMSKRDLITRVRWVQKREFWSGDEIEVLQLNISDSSHLPKLREIAAKLDRDITFYNLDIPTPQHYARQSNGCWSRVLGTWAIKTRAWDVSKPMRR